MSNSCVSPIEIYNDPQDNCIVYAAKRSADIYYKYLAHNKKGEIESKVFSIEKEKNGDFSLCLESALHMLEYVQIRVNGTEIPKNSVMIISYNIKKHVLRIRPDDKYAEMIDSATADRIFVFSDIKFLVKRVFEWYKNYHNFFCLPEKKPDVTPVSFEELKQKPSLEQSQAINLIFEHPFTYIWGAPGTGKTQFVLARSILSYVKQQKKILVTAPTNNALEQTLRGVLSVFEEAGIAPDPIVLRLGTSTDEFMAEYSAICEDVKIVRALSEIQMQIKNAKEDLAVLDKQLQLYPNYNKYLKFKKDLLYCDDVIPEKFRYIETKIQEAEILNKEIVYLNSKLILNDSDLKKLQTQKARLLTDVLNCNRKVEKYSKGLLKKLMPKQYEKNIEALRIATQKTDDIKNQEAEIRALNISIKEQLCNKSEILGEVDHFLDHARTDLFEMLSFWPQLQTHVANQDLSNADNCIDSYHEFIDKQDCRITEKAKLFLCLENVTEEDLIARKKELVVKLEKQEKSEKELRSYIKDNNFSNKLVIGATLDTLFNRLNPYENKFDHVFLDEAGYCPLIKGAGLTAFDCPITFLGDHMQLPPVCEMNDDMIEQEENQYVYMWAQSAIYTEEALQSRAESCAINYFEQREAPFKKMKKQDLVCTYRFGEGLANVLAKEVYAEGFKGNPDSDTKIQYIHAPKGHSDRKRTSKNEIEMIQKYVSLHPDEDIGILTPYRNQRESLKEWFKGDHRISNAIMTVHGSQGREWDTVILSVVDTTDKWFTSSNKKISNGRKIINTAVSRARKKLIIVCDAFYWTSQNTELISKLINVAEKINL